MRIWFLEPSYLDDRRLVAAHNEAHICYSVITNGKTWGHSVLFNHSLSYVCQKHQDTITEMSLRKNPPGLVIDATPMPNNPLFDDGPKFEPSSEQIARDIRHLRQKWEFEGYYFGIGRGDLRDLEFIHGLPLGKTQSESIQTQQETKLLYKKYKLWFDAYRIVFPKSRFQDRWQWFKRGLETKTLGARLSGRPDLIRSYAQEGESDLDFLVRVMNQMSFLKIISHKYPGQDWS